MTDNSRSTFGDTEPLFYDVPQRVVWFVRGIGLVTVLMILIAFIICMVCAQTQHNSFYYLLACNIIMSCLVAIVNAWWYKRGHLSSDKYWYMIIVAAVIIWQCIATDVYVFHAKASDAQNSTTLTTAALAMIMSKSDVSTATSKLLTT